MDNLTQIQKETKAAFLEIQKEKVVNNYRNSSANERAAVIRNIDSFLPPCNESERIFWLKVRYELERISEADFIADAKALVLRLQSVHESERENFINQVALNMAGILANKNTPTEQRENVKKIIVDLFNDYADQTEAEAIEESFFYIRAVLCGVGKRVN